MKKLIKMLSCEIGSLNEGNFGFSFWPVTNFSVSLKIFTHRYTFGLWDGDRSDPVKYPMLNKLGWEYHYYRPINKNPWIWRPIWSVYYGCMFGVKFYLDVSTYPHPEGSRMSPEMQRHLKELEQDWIFEEREAWYREVSAYHRDIRKVDV